MSGCHFVYKDVEGTSTEWDDLQRKFGNLPPKPPSFKPPHFAPAEDDESILKNQAWIGVKREEELEDLEDDNDVEDNRFLEEYRKKRLMELKETTKCAKYGSVVPITGADFIHEVSQAPSDTWVVVLMYKDGIPDCGVLLKCLEELASKYLATKFVKIISTDCIPNYPDCNLPTVLVYNNAAVKASYVGLHHFGRRCSAEGAGLALCQLGPVLNDGGKNSRESIVEGVRKKFIERVISEEYDDGSSSD